MDRPWTQDEIEELRRLYGSVSVTEIARQLGRTCGAVKMAAHKRGLTKRRNGYRYWTADEEARLLELLAEQRYTCAELAALLGRSKESVETRVYTMDTLHRPLPARYNNLCGLPPEIWKPAMLAAGSVAEFAAAIKKSRDSTAAGLRRQYGTERLDICKEKEKRVAIHEKT